MYKFVDPIDHPIRFLVFLSLEKKFKLIQTNPKMSGESKCVCDSCRSRSVLYARVDSLIDILKPNEESERVREGTVKWVEKNLDAPIQSVGSYPLRTYLPSSDVDLLVVEKRKNWYSRICSRILEESSKKMSKIRSLEFVNGNSMGVVRFVLNNRWRHSFPCKLLRF